MANRVHGGAHVLTKRFSSCFSKATRGRGLDYFHQERVQILAYRPSGMVTAQVEGSQDYEVTIDLDRRTSPWTLDVFCSCPYSDSHDNLCKHIWAVFLAVENRKPFNDLPRGVTLNGSDDYVDDADEAAVRMAGFMPTDDRKLARLMEEFSNLGLVLSSARDTTSMKKAAAKTVDTVPPWAKLLRDLTAGTYHYGNAPFRDNSPIEPIYVLDTDRIEERGCMTVSLAQRSLLSSGRLGKPKRLTLTSTDIPRIANSLDRQVCLMLVGGGVAAETHGYYRSFSGDHRSAQGSWTIPDEVRGILLPLLFQTGRFYFRENHELFPLTWDDGGPWELVLAVERAATDRRFIMNAQLRRARERRPIKSVQYLVPGKPALVISQGVLSTLEAHDCLSWARTFRKLEPVEIKSSDRTALLTELTKVGPVPPILWPDDWNIVEVNGAALRPELNLTIPDSTVSGRRGYAQASVSFRYGDTAVKPQQLGLLVLEPQEGRQVRRDRAKEVELMNRLFALGVENDPYAREFRVLETRLPTLLAALLDEGWIVLGNKKLFRSGGAFTINVTTGIDWFDIDGGMDFDGQRAALPTLLAAARKGERFVRLGDGSMGMLPEEWLQKHRSLLELGELEAGKVRFGKTQIGLIDAMLAAMPEAKFDAQLAAARGRLRTFGGIEARKPPKTFVGTLRSYQEQGLAWLNFLNEFGWGGCLADDMGLGKTVQMLALFTDRKRNGDGGPSLVVVPKSLVFNWMREAKQFAPRLRVLDYTGSARKDLGDSMDQADLVLTTYGTLKRDIGSLIERQFNYVVLDEAQAIKNPASQNAKAVRLLKARHRVAMTGTPVENHLGDLWSLFDFLNPGMLGGMKAFKGAFAGQAATDTDARQLGILHKMLRPFILRRTKDQVAPDLPKRSEQTIECEMPTKQAAYYKELREFYRASLLGKVDKEGLAKNKVHVLEALLRLRQAACHPGLIDESRLEVESAKLEALMPMVSELIEEGHKALIFSQFVKMLDIVRGKLDATGVAYEYLDGQTCDRQARVDRFQTDAQCPLFLISLKAGGVGLNLTAADYVFILDPWWNPAVEAQAIDRTHRIGQDKNIIAYRIVTRNTVESKILELQASKRALAESIITQANSVIQDLTRDDLALLLS